MRKSVIATGSSPADRAADSDWMDLERLAAVEVSSEDPLFPVEHALGRDAATGWRAASTGPQVIRLVFDAPQAIRRIQLHMVERAAERAQEFAVYAGAAAGAELREVRRQQWTFSPGGATEELEDFSVSLTGVTVLELRIDPDRSHDPAKSQSYASLQRLRLA